MVFRFENQILDPVRRELIRDGRVIAVEPKVFDLLIYLIENRERLVSKDDLIADVWERRIVSDSALASAINAARKAVGDSGRQQRLIRTSARKGIRFVGEISPAQDADDTLKANSATPQANTSSGTASTVRSMSTRSAKTHAEEVASRVAAWLTEKGLAKYIDAFRQHDIDLDVLPTLRDEEIKQLGLSLGDHRRLTRAIAEMIDATPEAPVVVSSAGDTGHVLEWRQLTAVFVEFSGSASTTAQLDLEEFRDLVHTYRKVVADVIGEAGGFVASTMGNGVLAYFGYPDASEDAAERSVRASFRAIAATASIDDPKGNGLVVRAGVATGAVVVGESITREVDVFGETPNLAIRLPSLGPPASVVVGEATRRLIGELFILEELDEQAVPGIANPGRAFRVAGERRVFSRFEAIRGSRRSPFVGRKQEIDLLIDRWRHAKAGDSQLVLLSGEAGIGKSRIIEMMWQEVVAEAPHRILYQCTSQHVGSPLYPALTQLAAAAELQPEDGPTARLAKLRAALHSAGDDQCMLVADLLGVPLPTGSSLIGMTPARKRQLVLDAFAAQLDVLCQQRPVLWVVEDVHWIDPTTEELITQIVSQREPTRLLIVITCRPEYRAPWSSAPIVTHLSLNRLARVHGGALVKGLAGSKTLPPEATDYIIDHADGVPLFTEELFQALCDSGTLRPTEGAFEVVGRLDGAEVPATLQDTLMARLDRTGPAKAVAQIGAVIGREFDQRLLSSIATMRAETLREALSQLVAAGLVFSRGADPDAIYTFKHALVQDAAYGSMLRQRRQELHGRIAALLIEGGAAVRPEVIAYHFEASGNLRDAVEWFEKAGDDAIRAAANQEAIRFWQRVLTLLDGYSVTQEVQRRRIQLLQKLASAHIQVEGYGSARAFELGDAALRIASETEDKELYIRVCGGNAPPLASRQDYALLERQLDKISEDDLNTLSATAKALFWLTRGVSSYHLGRCGKARLQLQDASQCCSDPTASKVWLSGSNLRTSTQVYLARVELTYGLKDTASAIARDALAWARSLAEPFAVAWGLVTIGRISVATGHHVEALEALNEGIEICSRYGYAARLGQSLIARGMAMAALGEPKTGAHEIEQGADLWRRSAGLFSMELFLTEAAHIFCFYGYHDLARPVVQEVKQLYGTTVERAAYAEFLRLEGLLAMEENRAVARQKLREAIRVAEVQSANGYRLRACHDLARILSEDGDIDDAREVLAPAYAWFTEGLDTPDLIQAKALLDGIGGQ